MAEEQRPIGAGKVVQQASVVFAGGEIVVVLADDGNVYGDLVHLCRALGLDGESQRERIEEQATLAALLCLFPHCARGPVLLKCSLAVLLAHRALLWLWRLLGRPLWISAYAYRREWVLSARATLQELLQMLLLFLLR